MDLEKLLSWLDGERYVYKSGDTLVCYGSRLEPPTTEEFEKQHVWEYSRNRMIEKTIKYIREKCKP